MIETLTQKVIVGNRGIGVEVPVVIRKEENASAYYVGMPLRRKPSGVELAVWSQALCQTIETRASKAVGATEIWEKLIVAAGTIDRQVFTGDQAMLLGVEVVAFDEERSMALYTTIKADRETLKEGYRVNFE